MSLCTRPVLVHYGIVALSLIVTNDESRLWLPYQLLAQHSPTDLLPRPLRQSNIGSSSLVDW